MQIAGTFVLQPALHGPLRKAHDPDGADSPDPPAQSDHHRRRDRPERGQPAHDASVRLCRVVRLASRLSAVAAARTEVEAAIGAWCVAVDPDVAILLTSELVTNAVTHATARRAGTGERRGEGSRPRPCSS